MHVSREILIGTVCSIIERQHARSIGAEDGRIPAVSREFASRAMVDIGSVLRNNLPMDQPKSRVGTLEADGSIQVGDGT